MRRKDIFNDDFFEVNRSGPYNGNGSTVAFAYKFKIVDEKYIQVIQTNAAGKESVLRLTTDYTVSGVGADAAEP